MSLQCLKRFSRCFSLTSGVGSCQVPPMQDGGASQECAVSSGNDVERCRLCHRVELVADYFLGPAIFFYSLSFFELEASQNAGLH